MLSLLVYAAKLETRLYAAVVNLNIRANPYVELHNSNALITSNLTVLKKQDIHSMGQNPP